jgi:transcriptional regulator with XRE-family HTH domain
VKPLVLSFSASRYGEPATFGEFIRKARLEKGLKQADLAAAVGVDEATVANWESYPTLPTKRRDKVKAACEHLGLNYQEMVSRFCSSDSGATGFGRTLVQARLALALTQEEVARKVGIDPGTLGRWERSANEPPAWMNTELDRLHRFLRG